MLRTYSVSINVFHQFNSHRSLVGSFQLLQPLTKKLFKMVIFAPRVNIRHWDQMH